MNDNITKLTPLPKKNPQKKLSKKFIVRQIYCSEAFFNRKIGGNFFVQFHPYL
jgi:hypothetical protein